MCRTLHVAQKLIATGSPARDDRVSGSSERPLDDPLISAASPVPAANAVADAVVTSTAAEPPPTSGGKVATWVYVPKVPANRKFRGDTFDRGSSVTHMPLTGQTALHWWSTPK